MEAPETQTEQAEAILDEAYPEGEQSEQIEESAPEVEQDQPAEESFTGLDPNSLPDAVRPFYKSMQADYTRKSQDVAEKAKAYEALEQYGGPEVAVEAINFAYRLETDPQFAQSVHSQLTQSLQAQGWTQPQAQAEASRQITEQMQPEPQEDEWYEEDYGSVEPVSDPRVDQLQSELSQLKAQMQWQATADQIAQQERALAETHSDWSSEDWDTVYQIAHSTQGNLVEAANRYEEVQNKILTRYLSQKGVVDNTPEPISTSASGEETTGFQTLDDPGLEKAVERMIQQLES